MRLRRSVGLSVRALLRHKVRTTLALSSVSAGVAAVVLTSALGTGAAQAVQLRIQGMGANLLVVRPAQVKKLVARKQVKGLVTTLRVEDAAEIESISVVSQVAPGVEAPVRIKRGNAATKTKLVGTTPAFKAVRSFRMRSGRFLTDDDDRVAARVAVLGARVADALFPGDDPVGQQIRIGAVPFDVIGVLAAKGVQADGDEDNQAVVPIRTALRRVFNATALSTIYVSVSDEGAMTDAETEIGALLRTDHRIDRDGRADDFEIQNAARMFALQQQAGDSFRLLTAGLGALALLVGGTGILALMLMSVKERTTEIGLRMAVGARPNDILLQFLLEATMLAMAGWVIGMGISALGGVGVGFATTWTVAVPVAAVLLSFGMALAIGLGFGAFPARKASLVPPIDALLAQ
jgi:putative ABC transport system permease protein